MKYVMETIGGVEVGVVETSTNHIIAVGHVTDTRKILKRLQGGCGFNGWTPEFFLNKLRVC